jgi:hypothetical protein
MLDISMPGLNGIEVCRSFKRGLAAPVRPGAGVSKLNLPRVSFDSIGYGSALPILDVNNRSSMTLITGTKPRNLLADDHPATLAETASLLRRDHEATIKMQRSCPFFDRNLKMTSPGKSRAAYWTKVQWRPRP